MGARLVSVVAAALALAVAAAPADALTFPSPYGSGPRAAVNAAGAGVVAWAGPGGVRAAAGDRSSGLGVPVTLGGPVSSAPATLGNTFDASLQVGIDDAGTAIVVWETTRTVRSANCGKDCYDYPVSTGVYASLRPAGGAFQPPVTLAGPQSDKGRAAKPRLAMSANGHAVIAFASEAGPMASMRGPGGPIYPAQQLAPSPFDIASVAVTDAGEALIGGSFGRVVVRSPNGSYAAPRTFPDATIDGAALVAANSRGDALVAYRAATGALLVAQRPAAGDWSGSTPLPTAPGSSLRATAMTGSGDGVVTWAQSGPAPTQSAIVSAIVTPGAAPVVQPITTPGSSSGGFENSGLGAGAGADVVAGWDRQVDNIAGRHVAQVAIRRAPGGFGAPITLTPADGDHVLNDFPGVAVDARGVVLATWVDHHPGQSRVKAIWLAADGASPVTTLETTATPNAPSPNLPPDHFASVLLTAALKPTRRGFLGVPMTCYSTDGQVCEGTITLRPGAGKPRAGRARFRVPAGRPKRIFVGLSRATRARLRRTSLLTMTATVANTKAGGVAGRRTTDAVFVAGLSRKKSR